MNTVTLAWMLACAASSGPPAPGAEGANPLRNASPAAPVTASAPGPAAPRVPTASTTRLAARHILVAYRGTSQARSEVTRTKEEARARAEEALRQIRAGEPFDRVARTLSDDPSAAWGGDLGSFEAGVMVQPFESAVASLPVGGLAGPVETPFGYHVVERLPVRDLHARHLVVAWKGAERAPATVSRTREEARATLNAALAALDAGEPWSSVVARTSDGAAREDGGDLGWFTRGQLMPILDDAVFDLAPGQRTPILETPRGFHVLQRTE